MKLTKKCSECGGTDIFTADVSTQGRNINLLPLVKGDNMFTAPEFEVYICGHCGHYQIFVPEKSLEQVRKTYQRRR